MRLLEGENAEKTERAREAGPPRREESYTQGTAGAGEATEGEHQVLEGLRSLWRQVCIGVFSVHSDAGWRLG